MSILQLQRRIQEAGRIRIGQQVPTGNGNTRPAKLDSFRLTSQDRVRIEQAAQLLGGEPREWQAPSGTQWEVVTTSTAIDVIVPPSEMSFSQFFEVWAAGGCQRRCDGVTESISDSPCLCDPDDRECKPHTRLSVMIRDLPGLGVWRIDTQGWYAATELEGAVQVIAAAAGSGALLPARLRLEQRQVKRKDPKTGKSQTRNFPVPVLDIEVTPAQLISGQMSTLALGNSNGNLAALPAAQPETDRPALMTPVPETVQQRPTVPVAQQATQVGGRQRKSRQANLPPTGIQPRTAAEAAGKPSQKNTQENTGVPSGAEGSDLEALNIGQLKTRLKDAGLPVSGNKQELIERLRGHETSGFSTPDETEKLAPPPDDEHDAPRQLSTTPKTITKSQTQRLAILMRERGIRNGNDDTLYRAAMMAIYAVDSSKDLSERQASGLIRSLDNGRTLPDGTVQTPDDVATAFLTKGNAWLVQQEEQAPTRRRRRLHDALRAIGAEHEQYPQFWERLTAIVDGSDDNAFAAANQDALETLVSDVEAAAEAVNSNG